MSFCDDIKNGEANTKADEVIRVLNYLDIALLEKRQYLKKVHMPIVIFVAEKAMQRNIAAETFGIILDDFFAALPENAEYVAACKSGSAKRTNIQFRITEMLRILEGA